MKTIAKVKKLEKPKKMPKKIMPKKIMLDDQLEELNTAENTFFSHHADVADMKADARETEVNLKRQKRLLAKGEKNLATAKKRLDKLKAKYKGWAKPKKVEGWADLIEPDIAGEGGLNIVSDRLADKIG